jgi:hypothetical protein
MKALPFTKSVPPRIQDVKIYFSQKGIPEAEAEAFFLVYEKRMWKSKKGNSLTNWKSLAYRWIASVLNDMPWLFNKGIH